MDSRHEEPRNLAEELDLPEQFDDDEAAAPAGGPLRFAGMTGSSIAGRDAAAWVTDFLNAAYYRRPVAEREVDDLRLAFSVLTTYLYRKGRGVCASPTCPPSTAPTAAIASTRRTRAGGW